MHAAASAAPCSATPLIHDSIGWPVTRPITWWDSLTPGAGMTTTSGAGASSRVGVVWMRSLCPVVTDSPSPTTVTSIGEGAPQTSLRRALAELSTSSTTVRPESNIPSMATTATFMSEMVLNVASTPLLLAVDGP